jgi:polyhydroxyalkanoate synthesis regulator phasin
VEYEQAQHRDELRDRIDRLEERVESLTTR